MKSNIALPPVHITETTRFTVESDYELTQSLQRYQAFYREVYGATVSEAVLLKEMARRFMAEDKEFQSFGVKKRRARRKPSSPTSGKVVSDSKLGFNAQAS